MPSSPRKRRPTAEKAAANVILATFRRLQSDMATLAIRFEKFEHQCDTNVRRCAEMQAEIDGLKKHLAQKK
jgi:hypothetical protein